MAGRILILGDLIARNVESGICLGHGDSMVTCLPIGKAKDIACHAPSLGDNAEGLGTVMVHVRNTDVGKCSQVEFRLLGRILRSRILRITFSKSEKMGRKEWLRVW